MTKSNCCGSNCCEVQEISGFRNYWCNVCASAHTWPTLIISLKLLLLPWQIWTMWLLPNVTTRLLLSSTYENITHFNQSLLFIKLMNYEWNIVKSDENSKKHFWTVSTREDWVRGFSKASENTGKFQSMFPEIPDKRLFSAK